MNSRYDAIVVGGGHNGLGGGGLPRPGRPEARGARGPGNTGGAATTETPWGPEFKMTALCYVMSLMPPTILNDLKLAEHGYEVIPMGPTFIALPDGRYLWPRTTRSWTATRWPSSPARTPTASPTTTRWIAGVADVLAPLLLSSPPSVGSRRPKDLLDQLRLAWGLRGLDVRGTADATRLFTMSIRDVLTEWFESPEVQGLMAINAIIGTWAGPDERGHRLRDDAPHHRRRRRRPPRQVGLPRSAAWARCPTPSARRPRPSAPRSAPTRRSSASAPRTARSSVSPSRTAPSWTPTWWSPPPTPRSPSSATSTATSCPTTSSPTSSTGAAAPAP